MTFSIIENRAGARIDNGDVEQQRLVLASGFVAEERSRLIFALDMVAKECSHLDCCRRAHSSGVRSTLLPTSSLLKRSCVFNEKLNFSFA